MPTTITDLSPNEIKRLVDALTQQFAGDLENEAFQIFTEGDEDGVQLRCRLATADRKKVYTTEVRARVEDFDRREVACKEAVDALGYVVGKFFSSGREMVPPLDWQPFSFGDNQVLIRGDLCNELLDEAASLLLAEDAISRNSDS